MGKDKKQDDDKNKGRPNPQPGDEQYTAPKGVAEPTHQIGTPGPDDVTYWVGCYCAATSDHL